MRRAIDRGSGGVTSLVLMAGVVLLALGGLGGAGVILRVTTAIREAELAAATVASRAISGDPTPCVPHPSQTERCIVVDGVATVRLRVDGVVASAIAGPER